MNAASEQFVHVPNSKLNQHLNDDEEDDETISSATSSSADSTMADNVNNVKSVNVSNASMSSSELSSDHEQTKSNDADLDKASRRVDRQAQGAQGAKSGKLGSKKPNRLQKNAPFNGQPTAAMQVHQGPVLPQQLGGVSAHHYPHPVMQTSPYFFSPTAAGPGIPPPMLAPVFAPSNSSSSSSSTSHHLVHQYVGTGGDTPAHWPPQMALAYGPDPMGAYYNYQNPEFFSQNHFEPMNYGSYTPTVPYSFTGDFSNAATTNNSTTNLSVTTTSNTLQTADSKKSSNGTDAATSMHSTSSSSASSSSSWSPSSQNNKKQAAKTTNSPSKQHPSNNDSSAISSASTSSSSLLQPNQLSMPTYSNGSSSSGLPFASQWIPMVQEHHQYPVPPFHYTIPTINEHNFLPPPQQTNGRHNPNGSNFYNRPAPVFPQPAIPFGSGKVAHHTTYFNTVAPAPHHQPIELSPFHQDHQSSNQNYHDQPMPSTGNRAARLDASFSAMNLNGADEIDNDQAFFDHLQPVDHNLRYKSKSKKNGRLNYTSNQYRSAQNRMSRGYYHETQEAEPERQSNENNFGESEGDRRSESNLFDLQDYKKTLNMVGHHIYANDTDTPFISGDSATSSASQFLSDNYPRSSKNYSKSLSYKQQQYRDYQRQQQKQYGSSFDYDRYRLSRYLPEDNLMPENLGFDSKTSKNHKKSAPYGRNESVSKNLGSFSSSSSNLNRENGDEISKYRLDEQGSKRKEKERASRHLPAQPTIFSFLTKADKKSLFEPTSGTTTTQSREESSEALSQPEPVSQESTEATEAVKPVQQPLAQPKTGATGKTSRAQRESNPAVIVPEPIVDFQSNKQLLDHIYNPREFNTSPKQARFFVIKSYSEDDIHRSIKYGIWCSTEHGNRRLDQAFTRGLNSRMRNNCNKCPTNDCRCQSEQTSESLIRVPVYLFFSVNGSGHFCGMAQMLSRVDYNSKASVWSQQDKWRGCFQVKWVYVKDIPNAILRNIRLENNENKPVTNSRDTQEIPFEKGKQVLKIFHTFNHTSSIFDDFEHYENLQNQVGSSEKASAADSDSAPAQECSTTAQSPTQSDKKTTKHATKQAGGFEREPAKPARNNHSYQQKRLSKENSTTSNSNESEDTLNMNNLLMFPSLSASMTMQGGQKDSGAKPKAKSAKQDPAVASSASSSDKGTIIESILIDNNNNSDKSSADAISAFTEPSQENNKSTLVK